ncbi:hypothetical protein CLHUN_23190 [Ruminiclostridium hungatei]|uniref:Uncharacterized protein n=1 Tax=Ruminiclostridium hungatei TaxID=48256 RepID=A0A1V4SIX6_RUMHU|nr:LamG-like jellyroll fold domain-containing protein [Ruminiclostridium hungatei]OPX43838.1 hypothetical protein CLHUN_23190 [Ruminiclostridium hungatei]
MSTITDNYSLTKPSPEDFYDIEVQNENMEIIDRKLKELETGIEDVEGALDARMADAEYQTATVSGTQIHIARQSLSKRLYFKLAEDLSGGVITISLDSGATSLPLKDIEGNSLTSLDKGYWEVVDNTVFFTLRPRGGGNLGFFGKYTGTGGIDTDTKLILHFNGNVTDSSLTPKLISGTNVTFGSGAFGEGAVFNGNGYVTIPNSADIDFGSNNFTIDFYFRTPNINQQDGVIFTKRAPEQNTMLTIYIHLGNIRCYGYTSDNNITSEIVTPISANTMYHYAVVRQGNSIRVYLNGKLVGTITTSSALISNTSSAYIGATGSSASQYFTGMIDEFRISGTARWSLDFTPPVNEYAHNPELTLLSQVMKDSYVYSNEDAQLVLDSAANIPIDHSDPVIVAGSPYTTSANARPQVLSNGWIVATVYDSTAQQFRFFVSKDNGTSYQQLCYKNTASSASPEISVCSYGTKIFALHTVRTGINGISCLIFDAATTANTEVPYVSIETQTAVGSGGYIAVDSTGILHAAWCSKNSSYPNSFNIRYSNSTDGTTWATPTQITNINVGSYRNVTNPCIIIKNNNPVIIYQDLDSNTPSYCIFVNYYNGTAWSGSKYVYNGGAYVQSYPSATITSDGRISVVWSGKDATDTNKSNMRYSESSDGGATWSTMLKLTSGNSVAQTDGSIASDDSGNLTVIWRKAETTDTYYYYLNKIIWNGSSWGAVSTIAITNGAVNIGIPALCDNYKNFAESLAIWQDNQASSVKFRGVFTVNTNQQLIPAIDKATSENQLVALGNGVLKTYGTAVKRYIGYVSRKSKGWNL